MNALAQLSRPESRPAVRTFLRPSRPFSLSLRRGVYVAPRLAYMLDSLVRVSRRAAQIRFTSGTTERGQKSAVPARQRPPPVSRNEELIPSLHDREPSHEPEPEPFRYLPGRHRPATEALYGSTDAANDADEKPQPRPARPTAVPRWHAIGRNASVADCRHRNASPVTARTRPDDEKPSTPDKNSRPQSMALHASPINDFKFF